MTERHYGPQGFWMFLGGLVTVFALGSLVLITADALNSGAKRDRYVACVVARAVAQLPDPHGGPCHSPTAAERAASSRAAAAFVVEVECRVRRVVEGQPVTEPGASCVATAVPATTTTTTTTTQPNVTTTTTQAGHAAPARPHRVEEVTAAASASTANPFRAAPMLLVTVTPPPIIVTVPSLPPLPVP